MKEGRNKSQNQEKVRQKYKSVVGCLRSEGNSYAKKKETESDRLDGQEAGIESQQKQFHKIGPCEEKPRVEGRKSKGNKIAKVSKEENPTIADLVLQLRRENKSLKIGSNRGERERRWMSESKKLAKKRAHEGDVS